METKKTQALSALDEYINKVYVLVLLMVPGAALCAGICYTFSKVVGWLPSVSWLALGIFDATCVIYLLIGIYFVKTGFSGGVVDAGKLRAGKIFLIILVFIQFNFILYLIPATDFWGFAFFFVILTAFFLDYKMVVVAAVEITASIFASYFIWGEIHLAARDEHFMVNMLDRVVCILLSMASIVLLTYLANRFLVNAKQDEMARNNERVENVLASVKTMSENLYSAGTSLSQIAENESASAQELSSTSEQLLESSNLLGAKTDDSMSNLEELSRWEAVVADHVSKVEDTAKNLLDKSRDNEKLLNDLHAINGEVSNSMLTTIDVAAKLSEAVKEIGGTLSLISDISSSTNLLSLNASIEAARAGEAGKGFAVVAQEVGNLANSTQESLEKVEKVIESVQESANEISIHVEENAKKLEEQNEYYNMVFKDMGDMIEMLNLSAETIGAMGEAHDKQADVIKNTVSINRDIAANVHSEIDQFSTINAMVESNVRDISEMTEQVNSINGMADRINHILQQEG